jgi:hypothetical protein
MALDLRGETEGRAWATGYASAPISLSGTPPSSAPRRPQRIIQHNQQPTT